MSVKLIKATQGVARKISNSYEVTNFLTREYSKNVSLAISKAMDHKEVTANRSSDRVYYVLEGVLNVKFGNEKMEARAGDTVFIPKNTQYYFGGSFKAVLINSPAFKPQDEQTLEK